MYRRFTVMAFLALVVASIPATMGVYAFGGPIGFGEVTGGTPGTLTGPAARAIREGPLVADRALVAQLKAAAAGDARQNAPSSTEAVSPTPTVVLGKAGLGATTSSPSDSTGSIGTTRYIETV